MEKLITLRYFDTWRYMLGIEQKECNETIYWIELLNETGYLSKEEFASMNNGSVELLKMLRSAIIPRRKPNHNSSFLIHK